MILFSIALTIATIISVIYLFQLAEKVSHDEKLYRAFSYSARPKPFHDETPYERGYLAYWEGKSVQNLPDVQVDGWWAARAEIQDYNHIA